MAYRDDNEALLAKIASLEEANAELEREIERLRADPISGGEPSAIERAIGSRLVLRVEKTIEGELPEGERARIVEALRGLLGGLGRPVYIGRSLVLRGGGGRRECRPPIQVTITSRDGKTAIRILERRVPIAVGLFGGALGATSASIGPLIGLASLFKAALLAIPACIALLGLGTRALFAELGRRRARELDAAAAHVARLAEEVAVPAEAPKVRVALDAEAEETIDSAVRREQSA